MIIIAALPVSGEKRILIRTAEEMQFSDIDADAVLQCGDTDHFIYREPTPDMIRELRFVLDCILGFEPVSSGLIGNIGKLLYDPYYTYEENDLRKYSLISGASNSLFLYPVSSDSFILEHTAGSCFGDTPFRLISTDTIGRKSIEEWRSVIADAERMCRESYESI